MGINIILDIGEEIRELRESIGYTQQMLADKIGIHVVSINRIENGYRSPSVELLHKIAQALRCKLQVRFIPQSKVDLDLSSL